MFLTSKTKLDPSPEQREWLWHMSNAANTLYNLALEQRKKHYLRYHGTVKSINYPAQNAQLVELKEDFPEFKSMYSLVAQEVLRLLQKNHNSFWGRLKKQKKGYGEVTVRAPKYRSHHADERYSTQTCCRCGYRQKIDPSVRTYSCPKCGSVMGRDENSAVNLLNKLLAGLARPLVMPQDFTQRAVYKRSPWGRWYTEISAVHKMAAGSGC